MCKRLLFVFVILLQTTDALGQSINGFVQSDEGEPLAGANVFIMNTNSGTSSNADGYYLLKLSDGTHKIIFSFLGYKNDTVTVTISNNDNVRHDIKLPSSILSTSQVTVYASKFSEAELLILKVLEKKQEYLSKLKNYTYRAYTKNVLSAKRNDSTFIGGILETLSEAAYEYPDNFQETIIARRQTKNFSEAVNIFSAGKIPNILEEEIRIDELRITSPLSRNALDYYRYELLDTLYSGDHTIIKLRFEPKSENQPLFDGTLNIVNDVYAPNSVELYGRNRIQGAIKQNVRIHQGFREYENYFRLPVTVETTFEMDMGFPGVPPILFSQTSVISNYVINNPDFKYEFSKITFNYNEESVVDSGNVWNNSQTIPLSEKEQKAADKIDSVMTHGSFLLKATVALSQSYPFIASLPFTSLSDFYHFNELEGNYWGIGLDSKKYFDPVNLKLRLGTGSRDEIFKYNFSTIIKLAGNAFSLSASYFRDLAYLDSYSDYSRFDITYQAILEDNDYADYYYKKGFSIGFTYALVNNITLETSLNIEKHIGRFNINELTDNEKIISSTKAAPVAGGNSNRLNLVITYNNLKYRDFGWITEPDVSRDYTYIRLCTDFSSPDFTDSDFKYSRFNMYIDKHNKFGQLLNFNVMLLGGIQTGDKLLQNLFHLPGSYGTFGRPNLFRTIRTDKYLGDRYYCMFIQNNFKNNIFKMLHLPWLKESKLDLIAFFNTGRIRTPFQSTGNDNYDDIWEAGLGVGNIINFFRLDFSLGRIENKSDFNITLQSRLEF